MHEYYNFLIFVSGLPSVFCYSPGNTGAPGKGFSTMRADANRSRRVISRVLGACAFIAILISAGCTTNNKKLNQGPTITTTSASLAQADQNVAYNANVTASGGTAPFTWTILPGGPAWLSAAASATNTVGILGTPTVAGPAAFMIKITDAKGLSNTANLSVTVNATPLAITTAAIANGSIMIPYPSTALAMTGGTAPFTWTNPGADLPPGFVLDPNTGAISGTPAQTGPFTFHAQVKDSFNQTSISALVNVTVGLAAANVCGPTLGNEGALKGEYAFYVAGYDGSGAPIALAASFNADGTGKVAAGGDGDSTISTGSTHVTFTSASSYAVGADNRGCVSLVTATGAKTFRFALGGLNAGIASTGRIIEFDDPTGTANRASGILRLQTAADFVAGNLHANYAFGMDGLDSTGGHYSMGGSFTFSKANGNITNIFSDVNDAGTVETALNAANGGGLTLNSLSPTTGRVPGSINPDGTSHGLAVYIVNQNEFFAITTDALGASLPILSGRMVVTGASGSFSNASAVGVDMIHVNGTAVSSGGTATGTIGILNFVTGAPFGTVTGTVYGYNNGAIQLPQPVAGTYAVTSTSGRVTLIGVATTAPAVYLTTPIDGISAFIIGLDAGAGSDAFFGYATPQNAPPVGGFTNASLTGTYTVGVDQMIDNTVLNVTEAEKISSGSITSLTLDFSFGNPGNLTINLVVPADATASFTLDPVKKDGSGTWSGFASATTYVVTDGTRVFILDDTSTVAEIVVLEQ
jgi:hypothetical protein